MKNVTIELTDAQFTMLDILAKSAEVTEGEMCSKLVAGVAYGMAQYCVTDAGIMEQESLRKLALSVLGDGPPNLPKAILDSMKVPE